MLMRNQRLLDRVGTMPSVRAVQVEAFLASYAYCRSIAGIQQQQQYPPPPSSLQSQPQPPQQQQKHYFPPPPPPQQQQQHHNQLHQQQQQQAPGSGYGLPPQQAPPQYGVPDGTDRHKQHSPVGGQQTPQPTQSLGKPASDEHRYAPPYGQGDSKKPPQLADEIADLSIAGAMQDDVGTFNGGSYRISHRDTNSLLTLQLAVGCPLTAKPGSAVPFPLCPRGGTDVVLTSRTGA